MSALSLNPLKAAMSINLQQNAINVFQVTELKMESVLSYPMFDQSSIQAVWS